MFGKNRVLSVFVLYVLVSLSLIGSVFASSLMWSQTYGSNEEAEWAYSLVQASDGGYAIAGGAMALGVSYDFWLVKTDENGSMQWSQKYGGTSEDRAHSLIETSDGGFALAGGTHSFGAGSYDFWLVKTDTNGNMLWNRTYGGPDRETAYSLVETSDGGYAIAGRTESFGAGSYDFWLVKTDANGNMEWSRTYGGALYDTARSLVETSDEGYAIAGYTSSVGAGNYDCWLVKTDSSGNMEWNQAYGGTENEHAYSLVETSDGEYVMAGSIESFGAGKSDFWLIKTDANGNEEWNQTYGRLENEIARSLVETSDGGYAIAGQTTTGDAAVNAGDNYDLWMIKTDGSGKLEWNQTFGGAGDQMAYSLVEAFDSGFALAGFRLYGADGNFLVIKTNEYGMIPEFPSWIILPLLVVGTFAALISRKKLKK